MPKPSADALRDRLTDICLALPEATCEICGEQNEHAAYRVSKKTFAYYMNNHHGDGKICVAAKVAPGDNTALAAAQPDRFYLPAYIASRGWVALRLDTGKIDWNEVRELVCESYRMVAPKRLSDIARPTEKARLIN
jgi:predicted DNA-binding protein (MmcQ/YjbR family)